MSPRREGPPPNVPAFPFVTVCTALMWNEEPSVPPPFTSWSYAKSRRAELRNRLGYAGWHWFIRPALNVINRTAGVGICSRFSRIDDAFSPWRKSLNCVRSSIFRAVTSLRRLPLHRIAGRQPCTVNADERLSLGPAGTDAP